ncbi:gamma-glutamyl-gamma-aminobutyrate hydrolase family protein [Yinghuangia seranimata]|uniref:gamma-glutamyl-gamma-aminobutyrate hydrolase family protein n=1 Tax=Yinghuangia seranimata TaxID=408067 RepID=UPI00248B4687|nr:type 1 glutamine amidotransferase [Yinghuangia seranimata]MDI2125076.1 type 1 glutamine amidotransferase [Yinghuangia seranimata]
MSTCTRRPRIAIPGRFSHSASALRFRALVNAQALLDAVWAAGGDPVTLLPADATSPKKTAARLDGYDGVLLPGGADVNPALYGAVASPGTDPPDDLQDAFDMAVLRHAVDHAVPVLTVCRGTQLLNVLLGGTLEQDMSPGHVHMVHKVTPVEPVLLGPDPLGPAPFPVSCYHRQRIDVLADALEPSAYADDGTVEAVRHRSAPGWVFGVQWHPEDTAATDPHQRLLFTRFVAAAGDRAARAQPTKERHGPC